MGHATIDRITFRQAAHIDFFPWHPAGIEEDCPMEFIQWSIDSAFRVFQLQSLLCTCPVHNKAKDQVLENAGFKKIERLGAGSDGWLSNNEPVDLWKLSR